MNRFVFFLLALTGIGLTLGMPARGEDVDKKSDLLTFQVAISAADPFHEANQAGGKIKVRRGEVFRLQIIGTPKEGYHTYPVTKPAQDAAVFTHLKYGLSKLVPQGEVEESEPSIVDEGPMAGIYLEHIKPFTLTQDILVHPEARPGLNVLPIQIETQVCDKRNCTPVHVSLKAEVDVTDEEPLPLKGELPAKRDGKNIAPKTMPEHGVAMSGLISGSHEQYQASMDAIWAKLVHKVPSKEDKTSLDLIGFILAGIFWGAVSLISPCVFPMIPITVSFFLKQSEKEHHRPITMALVYSATIVIVLTLAAAFLLSAFRWLSIKPLMNYGLGALFVFFALSLFGMYDIELPSGLARFTASKEGKGGMVGTVFMALTFTIISFACVAPFLGGFGGTAGMSSRPWWHNILGGLAYSITFAFPFFFLALFPTLLRKMPKSGSWLNSVKVVMGFLELAAAFKFFRAGELVQSSAASFFTFDVVLGVWIALCFLAGLYLLGVYHLPHDTPEEHVRVPNLLFAALFLGLGAYLAPALFKVNAEGEPQRPSGTIYAWVDSFLLPDIRSSNVTGNLEYAVAHAQEAWQRTGKPQRIFVDFTGVTCTNCKINERSVFVKPEFQALFKNYVVTQIYTDTVPDNLYTTNLRAGFIADSTRQEDDAQTNAAFQQKAFRNLQLPLYAVLEPQADGKINVLGVYEEGRINNESAFAAFLRDPK